MHDNVTSSCNTLPSYSKTTHLKIDKQTFHITKNGNDYVFAHLNCVSVLKHIEEIRDIVSIHAIDVLSLNETRLSSCIDNNEILRVLMSIAMIEIDLEEVSCCMSKLLYLLTLFYPS